MVFWFDLFVYLPGKFKASLGPSIIILIHRCHGDIMIESLNQWRKRWKFARRARAASRSVGQSFSWHAWLDLSNDLSVARAIKYRSSCTCRVAEDVFLLRTPAKMKQQPVNCVDKEVSDVATWTNLMCTAMLDTQMFALHCTTPSNQVFGKNAKSSLNL